jgi:hypothetical protein
MESQIGSPAYKIAFLSVAPSSEKFVADHLRSAIKQQTGKEPICMLKLFGKYDICAIYETLDFMGGPSKAGSINHIRTGNQILAFPWVTEKKFSGLNAANGSGSVWGLLFFRVNESLASLFGIKIDMVLAQNWMSESSDLSLDVIGTTGWAEIACIVRGKHFGDVAKKLLDISSKAVLIKKGRRETIDLFSAKTFSVMGIDFSLTHADQRKYLLKSFTEPLKSPAPTPLLSVTCPSASMDEVRDCLSTWIGQARDALGSTDLIFVPDKCRTWGDFIAAVLRIRRKLSNKLYSTSISVSFDSQPRLQDLKLEKSSNPRKGFRISASDITLFAKWGPLFENRLVNLYYGISNLMQDPLIGSCFNDLRPALGELLKTLKKAPSRDEQLINQFGQYIEALAYGAEERAHGAFLTLEYVGSPFSPTKGGIQRVIKAASLIPMKVLGRLGENWNGFITAGYQNEGFATYINIINMPFNCLFHPEQWFNVFHEVGHVALYRTSFLNISKIIYRQDISHEKLQDWANYISELGAELFDLFFCHRSDFNFYLCNIWERFHLINGGFNSSYWMRGFAKYFALYQSWKYLINRKEAYFPAQIDIMEDAREFIKKLEGLSLFYNLRLIDPDAIAISFQRSKIPLEFFHQHFAKYQPLDDLKIEFAKANLTSAVQTVTRGEIYLDPIEDPDMFILALKKCRNLRIQSKIAAILSMCNTALIKKLQ